MVLNNSSNHVLSDDYEWIGFLGKGVFGEVVRARHRKSNTEVAVKLINNNQKPKNEIALLRHLSDAGAANYNIVPILDSFEFLSHTGIIFPLYESTLTDWMERRGPLPTRQIRSVGRQLLVCLAFLREQKIAHRDLRPDNIMVVALPPDTLLVTVIDFGLAKRVDGFIEGKVGSSVYRAPEVGSDIPYGIAVDMWSFGCIMVRLVHGYQITAYGKVEYMGLKVNQRNGTPYRVLYNTEDLKEILSDPLYPLFADFVVGSFEFNPRRRMTPNDALQHKWMLMA